jgi:hypothetical protein
MESHSKTMGKPRLFAGYMGLWISFGESKNFILDSDLSRIAYSHSQNRSRSVPERVDLGIDGMGK